MRHPCSIDSGSAGLNQTTILRRLQKAQNQSIAFPAEALSPEIKPEGMRSFRKLTRRTQRWSHNAAGSRPETQSSPSEPLSCWKRVSISRKSLVVVESRLTPKRQGGRPSSSRRPGDAMTDEPSCRGHAPRRAQALAEPTCRCRDACSADGSRSLQASCPRSLNAHASDTAELTRGCAS
jgi:hypothetical protein